MVASNNLPPAANFNRELFRVRAPRLAELLPDELVIQEKTVSAIHNDLLVSFVETMPIKDVGRIIYVDTPLFASIKVIGKNTAHELCIKGLPKKQAIVAKNLGASLCPAEQCYDKCMNLQKSRLENFRPGIYLHYKDVLYEADHLMRDANDGSRVGVHYIGLEVSGAREGPRHLIRTWEDWNAVVHKDGTICDQYKDGVCLKTQKPVAVRFRYLGPFYTPTMLEEKVWP